MNDNYDNPLPAMDGPLPLSPTTQTHNIHSALDDRMEVLTKSGVPHATFKMLHDKYNLRPSPFYSEEEFMDIVGDIVQRNSRIATGVDWKKVEDELKSTMEEGTQKVQQQFNKACTKVLVDILSHLPPENCRPAMEFMEHDSLVGRYRFVDIVLPSLLSQLLRSQAETPAAGCHMPEQPRKSSRPRHNARPRPQAVRTTEPRRSERLALKRLQQSPKNAARSQSSSRSRAWKAR